MATPYELAQSGLNAFQANAEFKGYDIYFLSGIVEGLNERRRFIHSAGVISRCSVTKDGFFDPTSLDLGWEIDLIKDVIQPSQFGDNASFVGSGLDTVGAIGSGVFLSKRLINILRYYTVETSFAALSTVNNDYLAYGEKLYRLSDLILPNVGDSRYFGQVYRTFNTNTTQHYPCGDPHGGSNEQFSNPKIATNKNVVNVYANPDTGNDPSQGNNKAFYDFGTDLNNNRGSGYVGNGDVEIMRAIKEERVSKLNWPVVHYQGDLVGPKVLSNMDLTLTYPQNDNTNWALWTNKKKLFKFEEDFYTANSIPTDFIFTNEYVSEVFPQTNISGGNVFMGIREHFQEIISAISKIKYFEVQISFAPSAFGENPLITDVSDTERLNNGNYGECKYTANPGCVDFTCSFSAGPACCSNEFPPVIHPQLECGDCGAYKCAPDACLPPPVVSFTKTISEFSDPFGGPSPVYYTKSSDSASDQQGGGFGFLVSDGCPINTGATTRKEQMRRKRLIYDFAFTGSMAIAYRLDEFTTTTCIGFAPCAGSAVSKTEYQTDVINFPDGASTNGLNGAILSDYTAPLPDAKSPYQNCLFKCLPSRNGGGGQVQEYRQYIGHLALAMPSFIMIT